MDTQTIIFGCNNYTVMDEFKNIFNKNKEREKFKLSKTWYLSCYLPLFS